MRTDDALHGPRDVLAYETNLTTLVCDCPRASRNACKALKLLGYVMECTCGNLFSRIRTRVLTTSTDQRRRNVLNKEEQ